MPLVTCPDCDRQVSDSAPSCVNCGRPIAAPTVVPAAAFAGTVARHAPSEFSCPKCRSEDVRKLSAIWREGLSSINTTTAGVGAFGGAGAAAARTSGTSQTLASIGAAPPERQNIAGLIVGAVVAFFVVSGMFGGVAGFILGALVAAGIGKLVVDRMNWNRDVFPGVMRRWENSFRCNRCENVFEK